MWRNVLVGLLVLVIIASLGAILVILLWPDKAQNVATDTALRTFKFARKPPPPKPATPTPAPTPGPKRIERLVRVRAEHYPFRVESSEAQGDGNIRVSFKVRNNSGEDWPVAYMTFSSAFHPNRQEYRLDNWRQHEERTLDYVFPAHEKEERLREFRVENVSGVPTKGKPVEALGAVGGALQLENASGAGLGLWRGIKDVLHVPPPHPEEVVRILAESSGMEAQLALGTGLEINLEGLGTIDPTPLSLAGVGPKDRKARVLLNQAVSQAAYAMEEIQALGNLLHETPWIEAMKPGGPAKRQIKVVEKNMDDFFAKAVELHQFHSKNLSKETQSLVKRLNEVSETLRKYHDSLERQIKTAHPRFSLGN